MRTLELLELFSNVLHQWNTLMITSTMKADKYVGDTSKYWLSFQSAQRESA